LGENGNCDEKEEQWCLQAEMVDSYALDPVANLSHEVKTDEKLELESQHGI